MGRPGYRDVRGELQDRHFGLSWDRMGCDRDEVMTLWIVERSRQGEEVKKNDVYAGGTPCTGLWLAKIQIAMDCLGLASETTTFLTIKHLH